MGKNPIFSPFKTWNAHLKHYSISKGQRTLHVKFSGVMLRVFLTFQLMLFIPLALQ